MGKRVLDFNGYVEKVNEGKISDLMSKIGSSIKDNYQRFKTFIKEGIIKLIPSGPKKGTPEANYFSQENGSILSQVNNLYKGTEFAKMNPVESLSESVDFSSDVDEARVPLEWPGEKQEIRNVSAEELMDDLRNLYKDKVKGGRAKPIFIYGAPGIGKTQIVAQVADEFGVDLNELDLQFMSPEDFLGIPKVVDVEEPKYEDGRLVSVGKGVTRSNPPRKLPFDNGKDGKGGFIFMDEMNRANPRVFSSLMQFVQMGRIGDYQLPDKWVIIGAGNRSADVTGSESVIEFGPAIANRFSIVNFVPTVEAWSEWAKSTGKFPSEVLTFIEQNPDFFHYLENEENYIAFPTPRSWTDAVLILADRLDDMGSDNWRSIPTNKIYNIFADQIGPVAAGKFKAYLDVMKRFSESDIKNITTEPDKGPDISKLGSDVAYGLYELALRDAERRNGGKPAIDDILNLVKFYSNQNQLEILTWVYGRLKDEYPDLVSINQSVLDNPEEPENAKKIDMAKMVQGGIKSKGLAKSQEG